MRICKAVRLVQNEQSGSARNEIHEEHTKKNRHKFEEIFSKMKTKKKWQLTLMQKMKI